MPWNPDIRVRGKAEDLEACVSEGGAIAVRPPDTSAGAGLSAAPPGSPEALDALWIELQEELRRVAHKRLRSERSGHTLQTTALVHEVYLKLAAQRNVKWGDKGQFFALAAQAMRRLLVDYARRHRRIRDQVPYDSIDSESQDANGHRNDAVRVAAAQRADVLIALDEALARLAHFDERLGRVVECRFFGGYTEEETALALGVNARTVTRDWAKARAWLQRELQDELSS